MNDQCIDRYLPFRFEFPIKARNLRIIAGKKRQMQKVRSEIEKR